MATSDLLTYTLRDNVAWLGLNRPAKRNAISEALLGALEQALARAAGEARAIVIHGHGPCFSAGLDLAEHRLRSAEEVFHLSRHWHAVFTRIRRGRLPAIAALHGATVGGGLELAAACHIRVADTSAFFALPEGTRGIYVGGGASVHVARLIGAARMADMMLTGRVLDATTAERIGLVQYLVPPGEAPGETALAKAGELAAKVAGMAPLTVLAILQALPRIQDMSEEDGLFVESLTAALAQTGPEAVAMLTDFVEKRAKKVEQP
jgi:(methylthio)acryloyl-CoA hydratase